MILAIEHSHFSPQQSAVVLNIWSVSKLQWSSISSNIIQQIHSTYGLHFDLRYMRANPIDFNGRGVYVLEE